VKTVPNSNFDPQIEAFNPFLPEVIRNPYPYYKRLRESDPVHRGAQDLWYLTRYHEVDAVLGDHHLFIRGNFSENLAKTWGENSLSQVMSRFMFALDPPDHTRLRRLVAPFFTRKKMEALTPKINRVTSTLLESIQASRNGFDLIGDFAMPLPILVISEVLGVPVEDRDQLRQWTCDVTPTVDPAISEEVRIRGIDAAACFRGYFTSLISHRRRHLQDDLISEFIVANEADDALSHEEMITTFVTLIIAGHENITNLIGNGMLALIQHPEQLRTLQNEPNLATNVVQEVLRYDSPSQYVPREAARDTMLGEKKISQGDTVMALLGSANRDEAAFADGEQFDIQRPDLQDQIDFGRGPAFCIGAPLTLIEGAIAFQLLVNQIPTIRPAIDLAELQWRPTVWARGLETFPVEH
jgi:pimeloyl-[acyl-carrier protein] synthase